jgi:hypothetical protein
MQSWSSVRPCSAPALGISADWIVVNLGLMGTGRLLSIFQMHPQSMRRMEKGPLVPNPAGRRWFHPGWPSIRPGRSTISDLTGFRPFGASRIRRGSAEQGRRRSAVVGAICPSLGQYPRGARPDAETGWVIGAACQPSSHCLGPSLRTKRDRTNQRERVMPNCTATWSPIFDEAALCRLTHWMRAV